MGKVKRESDTFFQEAFDCPLRLLLFNFRIFSFPAVATKLSSTFPQESGLRFSLTVDVCVFVLEEKTIRD